MKKITLIIGILFLSTSLVFQSCKKSDTEPVPVNNTPSLTFMTGGQHISSDTTLIANSAFKAGVVGYSNTNSNSNIASFKVVRTFGSVSITVIDSTNINATEFSWDASEFTNAAAGEESWVFTLVDKAGKTSELTFIITTMAGAPYLPSFSPTYLVIAGVPDLLDFYITCTTDDWEMIKIVATYPGGLGSDVFAGNGVITTQGEPFIFPVLFPKLGGVWTFNILGTIKSGAHTGESFSVTTTMTVTN